MSHSFHPTSLREYDIRGIIGETLGEADAYAMPCARWRQEGSRRL